MLKSLILKDMDKLQHCKVNGFYDIGLDMYFIDLSQWLQFKYNTNFKEVL